MEKYKYDENNGLWYELQGDYYLPWHETTRRENQCISVYGVSGT